MVDNNNNNNNNKLIFDDEKINEKLLLFRNFFLDYNKHTNLTAITNLEEFNQKHFKDALEILNVTTLKNKSILDIGSGGGIPGLVFAIIEPTCKVTMIDSNNKKTKFIENAIAFLSLSNATVINNRIENLKKELNNKFDLVTARAVASTNILVEISAFACKVHGELIFYKGSNVLKELPKSYDFIQKELGIKLQKKYSYFLEDKISRNLLVFKKIQETKNIYPRLYTQIKKNPLY